MQTYFHVSYILFATFIVVLNPLRMLVRGCQIRAKPIIEQMQNFTTTANYRKVLLSPSYHYSLLKPNTFTKGHIKDFHSHLGSKVH